LYSIFGSKHSLNFNNPSHNHSSRSIYTPFDCRGGNSFGQAIMRQGSETNQEGCGFPLLPPSYYTILIYIFFRITCAEVAEMFSVRLVLLNWRNFGSCDLEISRYLIGKLKGRNACLQVPYKVSTDDCFINQLEEKSSENF
jgi:hypothetical protein